MGIPVLIVPGNHERSRIPFPLLTAHPKIFIFNSAKALVLEEGGVRIGFTGIPQIREDPRNTFKRILSETGWELLDVDFRLLLIHQAVEGATVGPAEYVFRYGRDVVPGRDIPKGFLAVLSGHIHRAQVLLSDLSGKRLAAPVVYPGSIERTSFAERNDLKGFFVAEFGRSRQQGFELKALDFRTLPARPMKTIRIQRTRIPWKTQLKREFGKIDSDSVVRIDFAASAVDFSNVTAAGIRRIAPKSMNVKIRFDRGIFLRSFRA
jgi:DNA repair exonuclease SbcCD nuclease subunit